MGWSPSSWGREEGRVGKNAGTGKGMNNQQWENSSSTTSQKGGKAGSRGMGTCNHGVGGRMACGNWYSKGTVCMGHKVKGAGQGTNIDRPRDAYYI